jgi:Fe-S cluster assembly iron-binding protein IscA
MFIETNEATIQAMKAVIESQPEDINSVRIFVAGNGCSGPTFGLTLDKEGVADVVDTSHDIQFVMAKDIHDQVGDMIVEIVEGGYLVKPKVAMVSACNSCSAGCG